MTVPAFFTVSVAPSAAFTMLGSIANSESVTTGPPAAAAELCASSLFDRAVPATTSATNAKMTVSNMNVLVAMPNPLGSSPFFRRAITG